MKAILPEKMGQNTKAGERYQRYADLHMHSHMSDGDLRPSEVVRIAASQGLELMALSDHDTTAGIEEAIITGKRYGIQVIPAIEVTALAGNVEVHILGYFTDSYNLADKLSRMESALEESREGRTERTKQMWQAHASAGATAVWEEVVNLAKDSRFASKWHLAQALLRHNDITDSKTVGKINGQTPEFPYIGVPELSKAVGLLKDNGAVASIAHPCRYKASAEKIIEYASGCGVKFVEVEYSLHSSEQRQMLTDLASQNNMRITGGTDYHGPIHKPNIIAGSGVNYNTNVTKEIVIAIYR